MDAPRVEIVTQLRSYQHATNVRGEVRQMAQRAADEIERLRALLRHADDVVIWEHTSARSGFQEEIEMALGIGSAHEQKADGK